MPEIKLKHVVSFSSQDKIHKAENLLKPETYRKWKCGTPGEKKASVILQFEKATRIHSIDIGNENSAFVEVLVGRSSDSSNDYQVLLVASSFMSPIESRNGTNTNRVRMFGPDKLSQNLKNEQWDCVQIVCTQPFNKNVPYGLTFVKFHSLPEASEQTSGKTQSKETLKFGTFKLKAEDEESNELSVGSLFSKRNDKVSTVLPAGPAAIRHASSFAAAVLASSDSSSPKSPNQVPHLKRKHDNDTMDEVSGPAKKESTIARVNKEKVGYKRIEDEKSDKVSTPTSSLDKMSAVAKKMPTSSNSLEKKPVQANKSFGKNQTLSDPLQKKDKNKVIKQKPFNRIMDSVVFVLSGFQNPLRAEIRDQALEMGAKYKGDWDASCTHLICAFLNTPKYIEVRKKQGRIVNRNWISDCHKKRQLLPWSNYMLGKYSRDTTSEEDETDDDLDLVVIKPDQKKIPKVLDAQKPSNSVKLDNQPNVIAKDDDDETDAEIDYQAATDADSSSDGDTEDEIRKVENKISTKTTKEASKDSKNSKLKDLSKVADEKNNNKFENNGNDFSPTKQSPPPVKPDTKNMPLPVLPDFFKNKNFFLYGDFSSKERHDLQRFITAYNGCIAEYMEEKVKYVITQSRWDKHFDEALSENENLIFVRPQWIHKCHQIGKCVPYQPHIVVPEA